MFWISVCPLANDGRLIYQNTAENQTVQWDMWTKAEVCYSERDQRKLGLRPSREFLLISRSLSTLPSLWRYWNKESHGASLVSSTRTSLQAADKQAQANACADKYKPMRTLHTHYCTHTHTHAPHTRTHLPQGLLCCHTPLQLNSVRFLKTFATLEYLSHTNRARALWQSKEP